jgi:hypothetical protein
MDRHIIAWSVAMSCPVMSCPMRGRATVRDTAYCNAVNIATNSQGTQLDAI